MHTLLGNVVNQAETGVGPWPPVLQLLIDRIVPQLVRLFPVTSYVSPPLPPAVAGTFTSEQLRAEFEEYYERHPDAPRKQHPPPEDVAQSEESCLVTGVDAFLAYLPREIADRITAVTRRPAYTRTYSANFATRLSHQRSVKEAHTRRGTFRSLSSHLRRP